MAENPFFRYNVFDNPKLTGKGKGLSQYFPPAGIPGATRGSEIGRSAANIADVYGDILASPFRIGGAGLRDAGLGIYNFLSQPSSTIPTKIGSKSFSAKNPEDKTFSDNFQDYMEKNDLSGFDKLVNKPRGVPDQIKNDPAQIIQEQLDALTIPDQIKTIPKAITGGDGADADGDGADTSANAGADAGATDPTIPEGVAPVDEGLPSDEFIDPTKKDDQSDAFTEAMKSLEDAASGETSEVKGLNYYKKQFADATGIDISGNPDTRAATIAFGLALGTYALQERKAAVASQIAQQQKKIDSILAIEKEFRDYGNQQQIERLKAATKLKVEALKQQSESIEKAKDRKNDLSKDGFKVSGLTQKIPIGTQKEMKVSVGHKDIDGQMVFPFAVQEASQFATGLGQLEKATSTLDEIESNVQSIIDEGGSVTLEKATDIANNVLSALGADYSIYKDEDGKAVTGKITTNKILQDRLISQYKRFLTQETGNGISTKDLEMVKELIGQVSFFTNPSAALKRIQEVRDIFDSPKQQILTQLEQFSDPKKHLTEDSYKETIDIINKSALGASTFGGQMSFDEGEYTRDDDGNIFIDLTNIG